MQEVIVEVSLQELINKCMSLAKEGYELKSVGNVGWNYEAILEKGKTSALTKPKSKEAKDDS